MVKAIDWNGAKNLQETVFEMIEAKRIETKEFKALVAYFGYPKLERLWADEKFKREKKEK